MGMLQRSSESNSVGVSSFSTPHTFWFLHYAFIQPDQNPTMYSTTHQPGPQTTRGLLVDPDFVMSEATEEALQEETLRRAQEIVSNEVCSVQFFMVLAFVNHMPRDLITLPRI